MIAGSVTTAETGVTAAEVGVDSVVQAMRDGRKDRHRNHGNRAEEILFKDISLATELTTSSRRAATGDGEYYL